MSRHFDRERELQRSIESVLGEALPQYVICDVELDEAHEAVRVFFDRVAEGGVGLEDCEAVNHAIRDTCPEYALEVSSPGIERPLRSAEHFLAHVGQAARMRQEGKHRATVITIVAVDPALGVTIQAEGTEPEVVSFDHIVRCKLVMGDPFAAAARSGNRKGRA